jgi:hypothetical protein
LHAQSHVDFLLLSGIDHILLQSKPGENVLMVHADGISAFHICHKNAYLGLFGDSSLLVHRVYGVPVKVVDRELIVGVSQKDFHLVVRVSWLYNNCMSIRRAMVLVK